MGKFNKGILLLTLFAIVVGCGGSGTEQTGTPGSMFVGGTEGLSVAFAPGSLPETVMDQDQSFAVSLVVQNRGDHSIENGADIKASITGIDPADFGVSAGDLEQSPDTGIRGAQKDTTGATVSGETISLDFPKSGNFAHQKTIAGSVQYNVRADVCYKYGSVANTKLCILEDMLGTQGTEGKLCQINEEKVIDKSGAPVTVTSFRESVSSANKVAFVFKVEHVGTGKVHKLASGCLADFANKDKVRVKIDTGISDGLTCSGLQDGAASGSTYEGEATLLNGAREIRCTQTVNNPTDIEKLVRIDLSYDYKQYIQQTMTVQHVGG
ncbi:TPA: hypothetical protein HA265_04940 [Candidatus Woesearchaeota archaeon]|nr:hypothetical protein [Candidatus Woesearchaeota archaeon]